MTQQAERILRTREAAKELGMSPYTLKKYARPDSGFLKEKEHWIPGMTKTSSKGWYINRCREALAAQGFIFFERKDS